MSHSTPYYFAPLHPTSPKLILLSRKPGNLSLKFDLLIHQPRILLKTSSSFWLNNFSIISVFHMISFASVFSSLFLTSFVLGEIGVCGSSWSLGAAELRRILICRRYSDIVFLSDTPFSVLNDSSARNIGGEGGWWWARSGS